MTLKDMETLCADARTRGLQDGDAVLFSSKVGAVAANLVVTLSSIGVIEAGQYSAGGSPEATVVPRTITLSQ